ncbi:unnamed protein product [Cuscuta campestris]|uniref:RING-type domain-containing protein n=1 Tax=Cuscuta campestris TaxID=132261 RepID=A0A484MIJ9_9ASTE|nr:unnamed protein product [Cuscuta campestris]
MVIALVCIAVLAVFSGALCILACLFRRLIRRRAGATTPLGGSASVAALPNDERQSPRVFTPPENSSHDKLILIALFVVVILLYYVGWLVFCHCRRRREAAAATVPRDSLELVSRLPRRPYDPAAGDEADSCAICMEEFQSREALSIFQPCSHSFHVHCIANWVSHNTSGSCPICRSVIGLQE